jgi:biotin synthase
MIETSVSAKIKSGDLSREEIKSLLSVNHELLLEDLLKEAFQVKMKTTGKHVYLRGLIELSNICQKNCFYCGIRRHNANFKRYRLTKKEVLEAAMFAYENNFGSLVFQSGELATKDFIDYIADVLKEVTRQTNGELGITLSLGEQSRDTLKRWQDNGAIRYLLRIESSNEKLYYRLHPKDSLHLYKNRLNTLEDLRRLGYHVGTGVMIGLPFQTIENLADDLIFMKDLNVDMVGMGPYIEHHDTPFYKYRYLLPSEDERLNMGLKMIAILRLLMPNINIASTTALETLNKNGRLKALESGANVFMPNLTPVQYSGEYFLYEGKPGMQIGAMEYLNNFEKRLKSSGQSIGWGNQGNSLHYTIQNK